VGRRVQIAIDCADTETLALFWAEVLNYRLADPPEGFRTWLEFSRDVAVDPGEQWSRLVDPDGVGPELLFHRVPEGKIVKNRMHLDVRLAPGAPPAERRRLVDAETTRLKGLGAVHVRTDEDETDYYAVMQDPEGNEFCIG
jgi:hypothetical protein